MSLMQDILLSFGLIILAGCRAPASSENSPEQTNPPTAGATLPAMDFAGPAISPLLVADLGAVCRLEQLVSAVPWSESQFQGDLSR